MADAARQPRGTSRALRLALAGTLLIATTTACGRDAPRERAAVPATQPAGPPRPAGWRAPNADRANTRWVGGPIDAASVARLAEVWRVPVPSYSATPIVRDGVVYTQDLHSNVLAISLATGRVRWRHDYEQQLLGPNGVHVHAGRVFGATPTRAFALDAGSGRELWSRRLAQSADEGIDMAPGHHDGRVYLSTVPMGRNGPYRPGARGVLWALDAKTGRPRWTWATVPEDLWGAPETNSGGGLWHTPAFDGTGDMYVAVANPAPFPGVERQPWGTSRPGPNRWTNAVAKLDARSGEVMWARQLLPHDLYDWDLQCPVILARAGGRPIAVAGGKMGYVYALDRTTGALLWKTPVGVHNGHDDDNLKAMRGAVEGLELRPRVIPGVYGGILSQMATDADSVYAAVINLAAVYSSETMAQPEPLEDATGEVVALDLRTGRVRWVRKLPRAAIGGATVVNDLVFTTTYDGTLWALGVEDGEPVWRTRLPSRSTSTVVAAGATVLTAVNGPGAGGPQVLAFRLRASR